MDLMKRARTPIRASITKMANEVEAEVAQTPHNMISLMVKLEMLDNLLEKVTDLDQKIMDSMLQNSCTDEEQVEEFERVQEYEMKIRTAKIKLNQVLDSSSRSTSPTASVVSSATAEQKRNFKLPKIELKKFNGELEEWLGWWSQFSKIHEDETLHQADKFHYLIQAMIPGTRAHSLVKSYPPTVENYPKVIEAIKDRFGDKSLLAEVYIRKLQSIVLGLQKSESKVDICQMYDDLETQLRCLESLEVVLDHSAFMLPLIESTLPIELIKVWQRTPDSGYLDDEKKTTEERLKSLMRFLKREVKGEERIKMIQGATKTEEKVHRSRAKKANEDVPTAQSLYAESSKACIFCEKTNHSSQDCLKATHMTLEDRTKKVRESHGCYTCFRKGHTSKSCKISIKCIICGRRHFAIMCHEKETEKHQSPMKEVTEAMKSTKVESSLGNACHTNKDGLVLMKTVQVDVVGTNGQKKRVRLLFDEGSNRSYIKTTTAEGLLCPVIEEFQLQTTLFGGQTTMNKPKKRYSVRLQSSVNKFVGDFQFINEDVICGNCPTIPKGPWMKELSKKKIYVTDTGTCSSEIEILIGSNLWPKLMTGRMNKLQNGLIAVESVFGWTLSGEILKSERKGESITTTVMAMLTQGDLSLPDLWKLESIGISDPAEKVTNQEHEAIVKADFQDKITRDSDGRYIIQLPWIDKNIPLPSYKGACEKSLQATTSRLWKENLFDTYDKMFRDWEAEGIIEQVHVNSKPEHYLPHHRVLKLDSKTTPVRPVFNASFQISSNPSLNDCLERGPNLLELIPTILSRFRAKDIGVISDIRKAYQMISVSEEDRNFQKFLWWEDKDARKIKVYRHCRVVFGMNCSPFILAAVLEHHFENAKEEDQPIAKLLKDSLYVDNSVTSFDTVGEYKQFREVAVSILSDAKMDLRQWESNSEDSNEETTLVLGMLWNKENDTLKCKVPPALAQIVKVNKKTVLSAIAKVYDPIGFTAPTLLQPKMMLQSSWAEELSWDQEWKTEEAERFLTWYKEVEDIGRIQIPRIGIGSNVTDLQLHLFTDASQDAYAAVVYARVESQGHVKIQLLLSKSRLAPLSKKKVKTTPVTKKDVKRITIPRLELLGCVIGVRLLKSVKDSLNIPNVPIYCWSDSTTALAWIKRDEDWGTFVGNRVREINKLSQKEEWRHVPGHLNPADLPSRGCCPSELLQSKWWEGPGWLYENEQNWPSAPYQTNEAMVTEEKRKSQEVVNVAAAELTDRKFGSYWKNLRTAAWVRRFITNSRCKPENRVKDHHPTFEELRRAEIDLLQEIQSNHFPNNKVDKTVRVNLEDDGLLHVITRLTYKEDTQLFKSPILLPSKDPLVFQLIQFVHQIYCHAGVQFVLNKLRERYWILQGRRTVNKVIRACVTCKRYSSKGLKCDPAPLPIQRIETQCAFQTTGVDLAGPFNLKGGKKCWVVLYTCAVYRGIYIDIVDSLSSEEFIDSLHKFTCVIGRPSTMFSDNGTNFVGAQTIMRKLNWKEIESQSHVKQIRWRFNPPTAAWWGGWWERLIRSLKDLLRRMIKTAKLTRKELDSCLAEISQVMNNRPLTTLTENQEDLIPLTPSMFMRDLPVSGLPELEKMTSRDLQNARHQLCQLREALKARFRKEYLGNLMQKGMEKATPDPQVGDIVLVGHDNKKRFEWPLGRILELFPGRDNKIRVAKVRTAHGILQRPIQRLYPLEISNPRNVEVTQEVRDSAVKVHQQEMDKNEEEAVGMPEDEEKVQHNRYGRKLTKPHRYGQWNS